MSGVYLLDANALIALIVADHEHHARAARWSTGAGRLALCPITEGALVRYLVRVGESSRTVSELLAKLHASPRTEFWPDSISYVHVELAHVVGHRQVTDAYLGALAASRKVQLASFDQALATTLGEQVTLIP